MSSELLKKVKKLEITTRGLVAGLIQGNYKSAFKGQGIEFSSVRKYEAGDDIRIIDWNVTSRMNDTYVKQFIEERDLTVMLLFDVSGSGDFGFERSKKDKALEIAASLMFAAAHHNDQIGLCLFSSEIELYIPPGKGRKHVMGMLARMIKFVPRKKGTNIGKACDFLQKIMKRRGVVLIMSDFMNDSFYRPLSMLQRRHDAIAINMHDVREGELPDVGYIHLEDEETGEQVLVNTSDPDVREEYKKVFTKQNFDMQLQFRKLKVDQIRVRSDENFAGPLRRFFNVRARQ